MQMFEHNLSHLSASHVSIGKAEMTTKVCILVPQPAVIAKLVPWVNVMLDMTLLKIVSPL